MEILGPMKCFVYTVEGQNRDFPRTYILVWLQTKLQPSDVDAVMNAEFPNANEDTLLYDIFH